MQTFYLPEAVSIDTTSSVAAFDYSSSKAIDRQQIVLNMHTISFLQEGTKEVVFKDAAQTIGASQFLMMQSGHCLMTEKLSAKAQQYKSSNFKWLLPRIRRVRPM